MDLGPKAEMREIRTSGLMSGIWKRDRLGHRARSRLYRPPVSNAHRVPIRRPPDRGASSSLDGSGERAPGRVALADLFYIVYNPINSIGFNPLLDDSIRTLFHRALS